MILLGRKTYTPMFGPMPMEGERKIKRWLGPGKRSKKVFNAP